MNQAGAPVILRGVNLELSRGQRAILTLELKLPLTLRLTLTLALNLTGQRAILRGPNGAGKSTLLKALSGKLPLAAGQRIEDERLRLGVFAQDLAQELPYCTTISPIYLPISPLHLPISPQQNLAQELPSPRHPYPNPIPKPKPDPKPKPEPKPILNPNPDPTP